MVSTSLQSLYDLCCIRTAYLMWTRHDIIQNNSKVVVTEELFEIVSTEVQGLPLPEKVKSHVLKFVKPTGKRLHVLLNLWLSRTQSKKSRVNITGDMLFESLVLNADGLINYRKTADRLLSSRTFHEIFAFRLASMNFLEEQVLKLWPIVKEFFLNKIVRESVHPHTFEEEDYFTNPIRIQLPEFNDLAGPSNYSNFELTDGRPVFLFITESSEVLFWIGYCLSKENATPMSAVPHFLGAHGDWYENALGSTTYSGNVVPCEYFKSLLGTKMKCNHAKMIEKIFFYREENVLQQCFIFHYRLLSSEEKAKLFREHPREMISQFIQWPLSLTFADNTEEIWNLIPDEQKDWVFIKIFAILYQKNNMLLCTRLTITHHLGFTKKSPGTITGIHYVGHLLRIWIALWEISLDIYKLPLLDIFVFSSILLCNKNPYGFLMTFETSDLKSKLLQLFYSNGELILELYNGKNFKESLRDLLAKHMPEEFEDLDRRLIVPITPTARGNYVRIKTMLEFKPVESQTKMSTLVHEVFVIYIKNFLLSSNRFRK